MGQREGEEEMDEMVEFPGQIVCYVACVSRVDGSRKTEVSVCPSVGREAPPASNNQRRTAGAQRGKDHLRQGISSIQQAASRDCASRPEVGM